MKRQVLIITVLIVIIIGIGAVIYPSLKAPAKTGGESSAGEGIQYTSVDDCNNITDAAQKNSCFVEVAKLKKDVSICNFVQTGKEDCYIEIAKLKKSKETCYLIQITYIKNECLSEVACVTGDLSLCELFESEFGSASLTTVYCYDCVAKQSNTPSLCEKIVNTTVKTACRQYFS